MYIVKRIISRSCCDLLRVWLKKVPPANGVVPTAHLHGPGLEAPVTEIGSDASRVRENGGSLT
jgi:hypothetical protein